MLSRPAKSDRSAPGDVQSLAQAYNFEGRLQTQAAVKDQKKLADAEAVFRKGLALSVELPILVTTLVSRCSSWVATQRELSS